MNARGRVCLKGHAPLAYLLRVVILSEPQRKVGGDEDRLEPVSRQERLMRPPVLVVGEDDVLRKAVCEVEGLNWVSIEKPAAPFRAFVKIRHKHEPAAATVELLKENRACITFDTPQRAITPGQAAVFYDGDRVLAGAWIR